MPIDPITGMLVVKGAMGAAQLVSGLAKEKPKRPELKVTAGTHEAVTRARTLANSSTRAGRATAEQSINQNASDAIQSAKSSTNDVSKLLSVASAAQSSSNQATREQDIIDLEHKQQAEGQYTQALRQKSYEEQMVHQDKMGQYNEAREEKAAMIGAGIQNLETVASDATSVSLYKKFGYLDALNPEAAASASTPATTPTTDSSVGLNSSYLNNSVSRRMRLAKMKNIYFG